jgi:hypothetical protein
MISALRAIGAFDFSGSVVTNDKDTGWDARFVMPDIFFGVLVFYFSPHRLTVIAVAIFLRL